MTVSAQEKFTQSAQSGSGQSWVGVSNLEYGNSGEASCTYSIAGFYPKTIRLTIPNFITSMPNGSEFVSLKITFQKKSTSTLWSWTAKLTGGTQFSGSMPTSYSTTTLDGDASYWGLSGTSAEIFSDLKDGTIGLELDTSNTNISATHYYQSVTAQLTYIEPDTKRAALLTTTL